MPARAHHSSCCCCTHTPGPAHSIAQAVHACPPGRIFAAAAHTRPHTFQSSLTTLTEPPAYTYLQRDPPEDWYANVGLPRLTARYLWWGLSANTRRTYTTARNGYTTFAAFAGIEPFPPTADSLCNWMAYLGNRGPTKSTTMKSYLTGLRSYCVDMGMDDLDVFHHPRVQRVIRGIKIFHGARG
jgi:hypothetical protein